MPGHMLNLRHMERDENGKLIGGGGRAETIQNHIGDDTMQYYLTLAPVQQRVYSLLLKATRAVTRRELVSALGLKKTGWFIDNLEDLVLRGLLARTETYLRNGMVCYWYEVVR